MIECTNGHFYTGYTDNLVRRYLEHKRGAPRARYTSIFKPVRIAQCWRMYEDRGTAMKIEHAVKKLPRKRKESIIKKPEILKETIKSSLEFDFCIHTFDRKLVEKRIKEYKLNKSRNFPDPFEDYPMRDN